MNTLDQKRVERLMAAIMLPIRDNYTRGPISRDRALEALNALAATTAIILQGADDPEARKFFDLALHNQLCLRPDTKNAIV